jgi:signal transduction histidine kinase
MRNKLKSESSIAKAYLDIDIIKKLESLEEYPGTKPILLSDKNGNVIYSNNCSKNLMKIEENSNLFDIKTEPAISKLFNYLSVNNLRSFCSDLLLAGKDEYFENHFLNLERVIISKEEIFIIYFDSQDNRKKLTQKINSFNQALESISVGVLIADSDADVKYVSKTFEDFFKVRIDEIYNKNLIIAFKKYLSEFEINELELAVLNKKCWVKVISNYNTEGDVSYKEIRMNVTQENQDDSINFIITANDITKHIQQARLLKKSEQRQKSIINNISDPILIIKREKNDLILESANNNFYMEILGEKYEKNQEILIELIDPVLNSVICEAIEVIEDTNRVHAPFHYTAQISNKRYLGKITFTDDQYDNTRLYIVNMTDITEQLEIEKKLRDAYKKEMSLNKLKSTFLANMSHEIRTPLNAIVGYSDLLEDDVKAMNYESSSKMTAYLKEGVNRLLKLVDNIVEVSLLESGNQEFESSKINLNDFINDNISCWTEQAKLKNITINFHLNPISCCVEVNEEKLERAVKELVENAIKYNKENGKISISTGEHENFAVLQIIDTGIGIEKESLEKIFKLFEQVEQTGYTRRYEGAGLGLSLSNKLISFMNGKMSIVSEPNVGTTITISFPKN